VKKKKRISRNIPEIGPLLEDMIHNHYNACSIVVHDFPAEFQLLSYSIAVENLLAVCSNY